MSGPVLVLTEGRRRRWSIVLWRSPWRGDGHTYTFDTWPTPAGRVRVENVESGRRHSVDMDGRCTCLERGCVHARLATAHRQAEEH